MENIEIKPTPVKELSDANLLELVCQLHSRSGINFRSKEMHDAYVEARVELDFRLKGYAARIRQLEDGIKNIKW